jgi:hypothetical protein
MAIAEWLSLNDHDEFMNVYAAVRGSVMKKSLDQVITNPYYSLIFKEERIT